MDGVGRIKCGLPIRARLPAPPKEREGAGFGRRPFKAKTLTSRGF
jgi:hypothetical protein